MQDVQLAYNTSELLGLALEREKLASAYDSALGRYKKASDDPDVSDNTLHKKKQLALEKKGEKSPSREPLSPSSWGILGL